MMELELWLAFVVASVIVLIIPGPTISLVIGYALGGDRRVAYKSLAGVGLGDFTAMTLSMVGVGGVLLASSSVFLVVKWLGAGYLIWLGVKLWRSGGAGEVRTRWQSGAFVNSFIVTALNPKSIVFFIAFVPQFISADSSILWQLVILEATFLLLAVVNAWVWILASLSAGRRFGDNQGFRRWTSRIGGGFLIGGGVALLRWHAG